MNVVARTSLTTITFVSGTKCLIEVWYFIKVSIKNQALINIFSGSLVGELSKFYIHSVQLHPPEVTYSQTYFFPFKRTYIYHSESPLRPIIRFHHLKQSRESKSSCSLSDETCHHLEIQQSLQKGTFYFHRSFKNNCKKPKRGQRK